MKDVIVIGGPNGAGKTTAANRLLPTTLGLDTERWKLIEDATGERLHE